GLEGRAVRPAVGGWLGVRERLLEPRVRPPECGAVAGERPRLRELTGQVEVRRAEAEPPVAHVVVGTEEPPPEEPRQRAEEDEDRAEPVLRDRREQVDVGVLARVAGGRGARQRKAADEREAPEDVGHATGATLETS